MPIAKCQRHYIAHSDIAKESALQLKPHDIHTNTHTKCGLEFGISKGPPQYQNILTRLSHFPCASITIILPLNAEYGEGMESLDLVTTIIHLQNLYHIFFQ